MDVYEVTLLAGALALAFVLRAAPALRNGHYGNDSYYHLLVARTIRRDRSLPEKDTYMVPEGTYGYPPLLHLILAPFAGKFEAFALRYLSPAIDSLSVIVVYILAQDLGVSHPVVPAVLVAISPMAVLQGASLNPRPLGHLALSAALVSGLMFWTGGGAWFLAVVVLAETAVMLSHKMSLQTLLVVHPAVAIAAMWYDPTRGIFILVALPAAFLLAIALTRGRYVTRVLRDHIGFIRTHTRHGDYVTGRKGIPSPIRNLKSDPLSFAGPFMAAWLWYDSGMTEGLAFLIAWSVAVLAIASFWPWGDAWRHMAFGTLPAAVIATIWADSLGLSDQTVYLLLALIMAALASATYLQLRRTIIGDQAARIIRAMEALPEDWRTRLRGAVVYSNAVHYALPYILGVRCLGTNPNAQGIEVSFRVRETGHSSLSRMAELTKELTGSEPQYFLLFDGPPRPDETGHSVVHDGPGLRILARSG